jgi:Spy/CpxP family protein refolding chaperone
MKNKSLIILIAVLLLSNIILAYLLFFNKRGMNKNSMHQKYLKEIGFNAAQVDSFMQIREKGREAVKPIMDSLSQSRNAYLTALSKTPNDTIAIQNLLAKSNEWMFKMDKHNYNNLMEAKKICTPEQLKNFDSLIIERFLKRNRKPNNKN